MNQNRLTRREFVRLAGLSVAGSTLAACVAPTAAPTSSTGSESEPAAGTTEVRFATDWVSGARGETITTALEIFAEQNPDIAVTLEPVGGDYYDLLQIQFSGGTVADTILFEGVLAPEYIAEGLLVDLSDTLNALNIDRSRWRPGPVSVFLEGDKIYGIPFQLAPIVWIYNKTLFEDMGVALPEETWDWNNALEAAQQLTDAPNSYGLWLNAIMFQEYGSMGMQSTDIEWVTEDLTESNWDKPGYADAIRWTIEAVQLHKVAPPPADVAGLLTAGITHLFVTGKIGMFPSNAGGIGGLNRNIADRFEWDLMPVPRSPLTGRGGGIWNDQPHVVTNGAQSRNVVEETTRLAVFLGSDEVQEIIAVDRGSTPTVQAIQESESYLSAPPASMHLVLEELAEERSPFFFRGFVEWWNTANKEYELGLIGERGVDETIEAMTVECNKVLASMQA